MRFGHVSGPAGTELFVEQNGRRVAVRSLLPEAPQTLDALIRDGGPWVELISKALEDGEAGKPAGGKDLPPLVGPGAIIAIGLNYLDHCREFGTDPPDTPIVFAKLPSSLCGPGDEITWRTDVTDAVDWEAELGVVIGKRVRELAAEDAADAIFGYTVVNDVTARDIQKAEQQWLRAKSLDTFCPIGPVLVTADEVEDPQALTIRSRVNGEPMQDSSTAEMIFSVTELIAHLSRSMTLRPGDVLATGTPLGVGAFRSPPRFLQDGDEVEVEVEGVGVLRNRCRALTAAPIQEEQ